MFSIIRQFAFPILIVILLLGSLAPYPAVRWVNSLHHLATALIAPLSDPLNRFANSVRRIEEPLPGFDGDPQAIRDRFAEIIEDNREKNNRIIALQAELDQLEREIAALQGLRAELAGTNVAPLRAGVTGRNADPDRRTLTINRGTRDGIREGLPVVDGSLLVGRVIDAGLPTATVELLTSPGRRYGAMITAPDLPVTGIPPQRREICLFEVISPRSLMAIVAKDFPAEVGDYAHLRDDDWPATVQGRIIGVVRRVEPLPSQPLLRNRIIIEPLRPIDRLNRVTVIVPGELTREGQGGGGE